MTRWPSTSLAIAASTVLLTACHTSTLLRPPEHDGLHALDGGRVQVRFEDDLVLRLRQGSEITLSGPVYAHPEADQAIFDSTAGRLAVRVQDLERATLRRPFPATTVIWIGAAVLATAAVVALATSYAQFASDYDFDLDLDLEGPPE